MAPVTTLHVIDGAVRGARVREIGGAWQLGGRALDEAGTELYLVLPTGPVPVTWRLHRAGAVVRRELWLTLGGTIEPRFFVCDVTSGWAIGDRVRKELVGPDARRDADDQDERPLYPEDVVLRVIYGAESEAAAVAEELAKRMSGRRHVALDLPDAVLLWPDQLAPRARH